MTRRTAAPAAEPCQLCGAPVHPAWTGEEWVAWEVCRACDDAFAALAAVLMYRPAGTVQIAGQLQLGEDS